MSFRLTAISVIAICAALPAAAEPVFNRIASFPVARNLPKGADLATETSAEIMAVTEDGNTLIYSDSPNRALGLIDITDPRARSAQARPPAAVGLSRRWRAQWCGCGRAGPRPSRSPPTCRHS